MDEGIHVPAPATPIDPVSEQGKILSAAQSNELANFLDGLKFVVDDIGEIRESD